MYEQQALGLTTWYITVTLYEIVCDYIYIYMCVCVCVCYFVVCHFFVCGNCVEPLKFMFVVIFCFFFILFFCFLFYFFIFEGTFNCGLLVALVGTLSIIRGLMSM